ncbi:MAG: hypothetical protein LBG45_12805 [Dysgonamonadaceae bacterium]|jgi:hypothetical protein|nr:hypothetical protein [Dysgonamonadaceae bacterium]
MEQDSEYSKETLDILGKMPNVFIRYGMSVFFLILAGIFFGLYFIHYPDTFNTTITIYEKNNLDENISELSGKYIGHIQVDVNNIGKIQYGSIVNITLNQYPKNIFGLLSGNITEIKQKDESQVYDVYIQMHDELITNFGKKLQYLPQMSGTVMIKREDKSILKRIFSSILSEK